MAAPRYFRGPPTPPPTRPKVVVPLAATFVAACALLPGLRGLFFEVER